MEMPAINPTIVQLQAIAKSPINLGVSYKFEVKKALLITGIALAVLSMTVWKGTTEVFYGTLLLGTAFIIKAVWPKRVADVNPVVHMLTSLYEAKKQALNTKVHGVVVGSFEAASKHVNQADLDYETVKQKESDYADIVHASETIVDWDMKDAFQRLDPVVQSALKQVQQAAHQFLYGDMVFIGEVRSTSLGQDAYISYRFEDSKVATSSR